MKNHSGFIKVITFFTLLFALTLIMTSCEDEPDNLWWSELTIVIKNHPITVTYKGQFTKADGTMVPVGETYYPGYFVLSRKYWDDVKKTVKLSKSEIDYYKNWLSSCGIHYADGLDGFYLDEECTQPLTADTSIKQRTDLSTNSNDGPAEFAIYTKVQENINSSYSVTPGEVDWVGENCLYTEYMIYDSEKNIYNPQTDPKVLLPTQTKNEDIKNYIFKNRINTGKSNGKFDKDINNANWKSITYTKYHYLTLAEKLPSMVNDPMSLEAMESILNNPEIDQFYEYKENDNLQKCCLIITLDKSFTQLGLKENARWIFPKSKITIKDGAGKKIIARDQKVPYATTKESLVDLFNAYVKQDVKDYKGITVDNIKSIKTGTKQSDEWDGTTSLKGEEITIQLTDDIAFSPELDSLL